MLHKARTPKLTFGRNCPLENLIYNYIYSGKIFRTDYYTSSVTCFIRYIERGDKSSGGWIPNSSK